MATITSTSCAAIAPAKYAVNGDITRVTSYTITGALSSGDVLQMVKVPAGAVIHGLRLIVDQLSGGNYTVTVGDGNDADRYLTSLSTGSTSAVFSFAGNGATGMAVTSIGYSYSAEDTIDVTFSTVTTATASGVIKMVVSYTLDNA